jgi:hypothetical protein
MSKISGQTDIARKDALTTLIKKFKVDTCMCTDTGEYETGIFHPTKYSGWVIVEQYGASSSKAKLGHDKWVNKIKTGTTQFKDVVEYGF